MAGYGVGDAWGGEEEEETMIDQCTGMFWRWPAEARGQLRPAREGYGKGAMDTYLVVMASLFRPPV